MAMKLSWGSICLESVNDAQMNSQFNEYDSYIFIMIMHKHILWNVELVRSTEPMPARTVINQSKGPIVQRSDDITAEYTLE